MNIQALLTPGDKRTTGNADQVAELVLTNPKLVEEVIACFKEDHEGIRMRAADALEKVAVKHPDYVQPFLPQIFNEIALINQQEVQWHVAQILEYLSLTPAEIKQAANILFDYITTTKSNIVKVFAATTLTKLSLQEQSLQPKVKELLNDMLQHGAPSQKSRAKKLIAKLNLT
jgi:hypothetical protein